MLKIIRSHFAWYLLAGILLLLLYLVFGSDGYFGGADNITHYMIARYAFRHPELFLNAWGRPLFTIPAAPFAQFGLEGVKIFNVMTGLVTAWLVYRIARLIQLKNPWMAILLVIFTPLYFMMLPTAMTEVIFSLVITLALFLFLRKSYIASAIVISFLPFARTEGFLFLPLYLAAFAWVGWNRYRAGQRTLHYLFAENPGFRAIPFLATGVIVFSLAGWYHFEDPFWVFTQFPYPVSYTHPIYNQAGSLWHFIGERQYILGLPVEALFIAGILVLIAGIYRGLRQTGGGKRVNGRTGEQGNRLMGEQVNGEIGEQLNRKTGERVNWVTGEQVNGLTGEQVNWNTGERIDVETVERDSRRTGEQESCEPGMHENEGTEIMIPERTGHLLILVWLVLLPFVLYLAFHSVLYWKAMGGSMGLTRVMAAVSPLAALVAMIGYDALIRVFRRDGQDPENLPFILKTIVTFSVAAWIVITPLMTYTIPHPPFIEEKTVKETVEWVRSSPYKDRFFFYTDYNVPFYMDADPFEKPPTRCALIADPKYMDTIPAGSIIIWDAHFGSNESKIPIDSLLSDPRQKLVRWIRPEMPWITFNGYEYYCCVTGTMCPPEERASHNQNTKCKMQNAKSKSNDKKVNCATDNYTIRDSILDLLDAESAVDTLYLNRFENRWDAPDSTYLTSSARFGGKYAFVMDDRTEFSPGICCQKVSELPMPGEPFAVRFSARVRLPVAATGRKIMLVISFEKDFKSYSYTGMNLAEKSLPPGRWVRVSLTAPLPDYLAPTDALKVYIWNPEKAMFLVDEIKVEVVKLTSSSLP